MSLTVITGGSRGLGKSMALAVGAKGHDVIITYNSKKDEAEKVVSEIRKMGRKAAALQLDAGNVSSFGAFSDNLKEILKNEFGRSDIDNLVNNAGVGVNVPFMDATEEQFDMLVNLHVKGVFFLSQKLLPIIKDGGKIINISSGLARFCLPGYSMYASMKGAVEVLSRYMAKELGARKISVNVVAPGAIETDFGGGHVRDNAQVNSFIASQTALGRAGLPEDIGGAVAAMLSEDCRWINGQRVEVSGGMML